MHLYVGVNGTEYRVTTKPTTRLVFQDFTVLDGCVWLCPGDMDAGWGSRVASGICRVAEGEEAAGAVKADRPENLFGIYP